MRVRVGAFVALVMLSALVQVGCSTKEQRTCTVGSQPQLAPGVGSVEGKAECTTENSNSAGDWLGAHGLVLGGGVGLLVVAVLFLRAVDRARDSASGWPVPTPNSTSPWPGSPRAPESDRKRDQQAARPPVLAEVSSPEGRAETLNDLDELLPDLSELLRAPGFTAERRERFASLRAEVTDKQSIVESAIAFDWPADDRRLAGLPERVVEIRLLVDRAMAGGQTRTDS